VNAEQRLDPEGIPQGRHDNALFHGLVGKVRGRERCQVEIQVMHRGAGVIVVGGEGQVGELDEAGHSLLEHNVFRGNRGCLVRKHLSNRLVEMLVLVSGVEDQELHQFVHSRSIRRSFEETGEIGPGHEVPMVGLAKPGSQLAVPALALGQLVGVLLLDGDYVIKGVAGKLLWSLLRQFQMEGRTDFTNREVRLDASLDLPDFRDNFESRLILLKRRLDERDSLVRIEKTGRGRFRLDVDATLRLEAVDA
jgi:hypothetical protein